MELQLLMADYINGTQDGKHVLAGLYADRRVIFFLPPDASGTLPPGAPSMSFLATISEVQAGDHVCRARIIDPDGQVFWTAHETRFPSLEAGGVNVVYGVSPFVVPRPGTYRFQVEIDGTTLEQPYAVMYSTSASVPQPPPDPGMP